MRQACAASLNDEIWVLGGGTPRQVKFIREGE